MRPFYDNGSFVEIYETNHSAFSYKRSEVIKNFLENKKIKVKNCLDLACGTGLFLNNFCKTCDLTGMGLDFSEKMINFANKNVNNKNLTFLLGDMTDFSINKKFDLITCNYNSINEILDDQKLNNMFICCYNHLNNGAFFMFDFNTPRKYIEGKKYNYYKEKDFNMVAERIKEKNNLVLYNYHIYKKTHNNTYIIENTQMYEKFFEPKYIKKLLKNNGFKKIRFLDENFKRTNVKKLKRIFVVCKK